LIVVSGVLSLGEVRLIPLLGIKPLIGVIHLPPLPRQGRRGANLDDIVDYAVSEALKLERAGFDAVVLENYGDKPYHVEWKDKITAALLAVIAKEVKKNTNLEVIINVLRNDVEASIAAAYASGARFIRVNSYCEHRISIEGNLKPTANMIEDILSSLNKYIGIMADIDVKHSIPLTKLRPDIMKDCALRGSALAFIATGPSTGEPPSPGYLVSIREAIDTKPVIVGSGISLDNIKLYWRIADGYIVGTSIKVSGTESRIDEKKAEKLASEVRQLRRQIVALA